MAKFKPIITKEKIKQYLETYPYLTQKIHQRELCHIKYGPSLDEYRNNINRIEDQVIAMSEDLELQEMRFYKDCLERNLYILKITKDSKYYNFILWNYFKKLPKKEIQKKLGSLDIKAIDCEVIDFLYNTLLKEALKNG